MSALDVVVFILAQALAVTFIVASINRGVFRRYLFLNLYMASLVSAEVFRAAFLRLYGLKSEQFFYAYYGSDFFIVALKYVAIVSVFEIILHDSPFRAQARLAFLVFFTLVAAMSYAFMSTHLVNHFYRRLIIEFQQNIHFAAVVLTVLACATLGHLHVSDARLRMLVYGFGVSAATQSGWWALQNLLTHEQRVALFGVQRFVVPLATFSLLVLWCYAVIRVPAFEEAPAKPRTRPAGAGLFAPTFIKAEARG